MRRLGKLAVAGVALVAGLGTALVATDEANGPAPAGGQTLREPWRPLPRSTATRVRGFHSLQSFWTGSEVLVLAGAAYSGDRVAAAAYDPAAGRWRRLARSPLGWRFGQASVWTGSELIVWGGTSAMGERTDGARYDPVSDSWTAISRSPLRQPYARTAVWTGKEMLVWGGGSAASDGEAYDPGTDRWRRIAPSPLRGRFGHTAVWTGREMLVWAGRGIRRSGRLRGHTMLLTDGAAYDPKADRWRRLRRSPVRSGASSEGVWTGRTLLIWNGVRGASYEPRVDRWKRMPNAPLRGRSGHSVVWTGREMIVWGGNARGCEDYLPPCFRADGAAYAPRARRWRLLPRAPLRPRAGHTAVWTGKQMLVWAGCCRRSGRYFDDGASYRPVDTRRRGGARRGREQAGERGRLSRRGS